MPTRKKHPTVALPSLITGVLEQGPSQFQNYIPVKIPPLQCAPHKWKKNKDRRDLEPDSLNLSSSARIAQLKYF